MNYRAGAALAIGKRRLFESFIHPGFYIALAIGMGITYALTAAFVRSVDSSGFDYTLNPFYNFVGGIISGAFGASFLAKVFARGPFLFALHVAFIPVLLYLAMTSVYRFGTEKRSGAIELLCYGPCDGTAYFLASMIKDTVLTAIALAAFLLFFLVAGPTDNLAITGPLLVSLVVLFLAALCMYAYERVAPVGVRKPSSGLKAGEKMPALELQTLDGRPLRLSGGSGKGKSTLLFFLSPSCPVCKRLLPVLQAIRNSEAGWLEIVLAGDGDKKEHSAWLQAQGMESWLYVLSPQLGMTMRVGQLPFAALVDKSGILLARNPVNNAEQIESMLGERYNEMA